MQRGEKQNRLNAEGELIPADTPPPKINLQNAAAIRREFANVYRDARAGRIRTQDATRFGYLLGLLGQAYEREVLENRLEALEAQQHEND